MNPLPRHVKIVEVGPRDGLQNETAILDTASKIEFIERLAATGLTVIEATSFVDPQRVPQLADAEAVLARLDRQPDTAYPVLVPNQLGMDRAVAAGATEIAIFTAASETFNRKNIGCGIAESITRYAPIVRQARDLGVEVRAYVSCALGCPYEGRLDPMTAAQVAYRLYDLGCDEIAFGDTVGMGTPLQARTLVESTANRIPVDRLAVHFHDTRGQALANILACLDAGVEVVDAAVAGLGGCPYAQGASGNVATEDLVYMLDGMGIDTDVDLAKLIRVGEFICQKLGRANRSRVAQAGREHRA